MECEESFERCLMKVAVLAVSESKANRIVEVLKADGRFFISRVNEDARLGSFEVLVVDGLAPEHLAAEGPPVVLIDTGGLAGEVFEARIHALLPPDFTPEELTACVSAAGLELTVLTDSQARSWLRRRSTPATEFPLEPLTARELEVLRLMADGLGNKEMAGRLGISDHTAKFHVAQVLAKLHASSRTEAVTIGIRRGLVPL